MYAARYNGWPRHIVTRVGLCDVATSLMVCRAKMAPLFGAMYGPKTILNW